MIELRAVVSNQASGFWGTPSRGHTVQGRVREVAVTGKVLPPHLLFSDSVSRTGRSGAKSRGSVSAIGGRRAPVLRRSSVDHFTGSQPSGSISNASVSR